MTGLTFDSSTRHCDHVHRFRNNISLAYVDEQFFFLDEKNNPDFFVELVVPGFVNFLVSWVKAEARSKPVHWITFKDAIHQPSETIIKVLNVHGVPVNGASVSDVLLNADVSELRKNKGMEGLGSRLLSQFQIEKVIQSSRSYPEVDFSLLGKNEKFTAEG